MDTTTRHSSAPDLRVPEGRLPVAPLESFIRSRKASLPRGGDGERLRKAYYRGLRRGHISEEHADELAAVVLGVHPSAVWGTAWTDLEGVAGDGLDADEL